MSLISKGMNDRDLLMPKLARLSLETDGASEYSPPVTLQELIFTEADLRTLNLSVNLPDLTKWRQRYLDGAPIAVDALPLSEQESLANPDGPHPGFIDHHHFVVDENNNVYMTTNEKTTWIVPRENGSKPSQSK